MAFKDIWNSMKISDNWKRMGPALTSGAIFGALLLLRPTPWDLGFVLALGLFGLLLFMYSTTAKWVSLGASLVTGAVIGVSLFISQANFSLEQQAMDEKVERLRTAATTAHEDLTKVRRQLSHMARGNGLRIHLGRGCDLILRLGDVGPSMGEQLSSPDCKEFFEAIAERQLDG